MRISIQKVNRASENSYTSTKNTISNRNRDEESSIPVVWAQGQPEPDRRYRDGSIAITSEL
jgi:hypothetical protein